MVLTKVRSSLIKLKSDVKNSRCLPVLLYLGHVALAATGRKTADIFKYYSKIILSAP